MFKLKKTITLLTVILDLACIHAQKIRSMDFNSQKKTDILLVLAKECGISIIPDETVKGETSFHFENMDARTALDSFLKASSLYARKTGEALSVSAISAEYDPASGKITVYARETSVKSILNRIGEEAGVTVLTDDISEVPVTVSIIDSNIKDALEICTKKLAGFYVESSKNCYYIRKKAESGSSALQAFLTKEDGLYSCDIQSSSLEWAVRELFEKEGREYVMFADSSASVSGIHVKNRTFDQMLELFMTSSGCTGTERDGTFYILKGNSREKSDSLKSIHLFPLSNISAQDLAALLPSAVTSSSDFRISKNSNSIILWASEKEARSFRELLAVLDCPDSLENRIIAFKNLEAREAAALIPSELILGNIAVLDKMNAVSVSTSGKLMKQVEAIAEAVDVREKARPVHLRYIKTTELFQKLPPSVEASWIKESGYPNLIFFTGPENCLNTFTEELSLIDRPQPQIKYQLLVVQYNQGKGSSLRNSLSVQKLNEDKNFLFSGELSNITSLAFNVIDSLGWQFAASLNASLAENRAKIYTDTSLTSISGQEVKFQNTDTYRYLEYEYDSGSGLSTASGVTQQITSGLIVSLKGWISGDSMITMDINATVSKQNGEGSSSSLPSTSERIINTQVRAQSGKSIIISGLIKEDETVTESTMPLLGKIPFIGRFFTTKTESREKSEIEIYIIPYLLQDETEDEFNCEKLYRNLFSNETNGGNA